MFAYFLNSCCLLEHDLFPPLLFTVMGATSRCDPLLVYLFRPAGFDHVLNVRQNTNDSYITGNGDRYSAVAYLA